MINFLVIFIVLLGAYVTGAIPTGYWFARWWAGIDITKEGSCNTGASNIGRVLGVCSFIPVFLFDCLKSYGYLIFVCWWVGLSVALVTAGVLLVGNAYSCFLKFKGGKGVATTVGILCALYPALFVSIFIISWVTLIIIIKKPVIASLVSMGLVIFTGVHLCSLEKNLLYFLIFLALWMVWRHRVNLTHRV
jgi:glycerol-3-phosphate acyltransferase PlsY